MIEICVDFEEKLMYWNSTIGGISPDQFEALIMDKSYSKNRTKVNYSDKYRRVKPVNLI
ncbi:MAG: hypothetical protein RLO17_08195 [Cyclobacteriaceae bacterium]